MTSEPLSPTPPLQEAFHESDRARLLRWVPGLHLLQAFRLATRWQNLALAFLGVMLLAGGRYGLSLLPFASSAVSRFDEADRSGKLLLSWTGSDQKEELRLPWEQQFLNPPLPATHEVLTASRFPAARTLLTPFFDLLKPSAQLVQRRQSWASLAYGVLHLLLILLIGSLVGGAIARRVALEFCAGAEPSFRQSLASSLRGFPTAIGAPLIAFVGIGLLTLIGRIIAWTGRIPGTEGSVAAALWGAVLLLGLVSALILVGVVAAWPLMVAAHSVEQTDAFDALNRSYNYVFVRPWYAAGLWLSSLVYGLVVLTFLLALTGLTVHLAERIAGGPMSEESLAAIAFDAPEMVHPGIGAAAIDAPTTQRLGGMWYRGLAGVLTGFVYSYFWTVATLIYLLLRRSADGAELREVTRGHSGLSVGNPPLAGIAASARREAERCTTPPSESA
ncbi:MAG: hypothetical protein R3B90_03740 [Planctomycetaceae bacterium]